MGKGNAAETVYFYGKQIVGYHHRSCRGFCVDYRDFHVDYESGIIIATLDAHQANSSFFIDMLSHLELENFERNPERYLQNEIRPSADDERSCNAFALHNCFRSHIKRTFYDLLVLDFD